MAAQARFKVVVRRRTNEALVRPPFDTADRGNATGLVVENKTDFPIHVIIPKGLTDQNVPGTADPFQSHLITAGGTATLRVFATAPKGAHTIHIFCEETNSMAQGNSDPELIIQ
jgi:hypothetical protein